MDKNDSKDQGDLVPQSKTLFLEIPVAVERTKDWNDIEETFLPIQIEVDNFGPDYPLGYDIKRTLWGRYE